MRGQLRGADAQMYVTYKVTAIAYMENKMQSLLRGSR